MDVKRKKYSKQFKLDAIRMYENGEKSMAQVERELGITQGCLRNGEIELLASQGTGGCISRERQTAQTAKRASGSWSERMPS